MFRRGRIGTAHLYRMGSLRLRKLIEADPAKPAFIQTVWGFGYVFVPDGAERQ